MTPVALETVKARQNDELVEALEAVLEQAKKGEFTRMVLVKLTQDHSFAVQVVGVGSDLATVSALEFAKHDLISANVPSAENR